MNLKSAAATGSEDRQAHLVLINSQNLLTAKYSQ